MPKDKPFKNEIEAFYVSNIEDIALYMWVEAIQDILPSVKLKTAIEMFKKRFGLSEEDFSLESALYNYQRTRKKAMDAKRIIGQKT